MSASLFNGFFDSVYFMGAQIIHHNDITRTKSRYKVAVQYIP